MKYRIWILIFGLFSIFSGYAQYIVPGEEWLDTDGNPINAHGGGILYHEGVYYWYGEYKGGCTYRSPGVDWDCYRTDVLGVSCYSSKDLYHWKFEGLVLESDTLDPQSDIHPTRVIERPKVIYNDKTGKFVMWMHIDNYNYRVASAGVAVSDSPVGKFTYLGSMQPNGQNCRDMTLFKDDDGKAYHIYSSEENSTLCISLLSDDYLSHSGVYTKNFQNRFREAPAVFKRENKYYLVTSGCSGWDPNEAEYAVADSLLGVWTAVENPCRGKDADKTFYGQSTFVLPVAGEKDCYIMMLDKWCKTDLKESKYIWLPIAFNGDGLTIFWKDRWLLGNMTSALLGEK